MPIDQPSIEGWGWFPSFKTSDWLCFSRGLEFLMSSVPSGCHPAADADPRSVTPQQHCPVFPLSLKDRLCRSSLRYQLMGRRCLSRCKHPFLFLTDWIQKPQEIRGHILSGKAVDHLSHYKLFLLQGLKETYPLWDVSEMIHFQKYRIKAVLSV